MVLHLFSHLRKLLRPYWKQVFVSSVFLVLITAGQLVIPDQIIDRTYKRETSFFGEGLVAQKLGIRWTGACWQRPGS